jgi:hypothetical protein
MTVNVANAGSRELTILELDAGTGGLTPTGTGLRHVVEYPTGGRIDRLEAGSADAGTERSARRAAGCDRSLPGRGRPSPACVADRRRRFERLGRSQPASDGRPGRPAARVRATRPGSEQPWSAETPRWHTRPVCRRFLRSRIASPAVCPGRRCPGARSICPRNLPRTDSEAESMTAESLGQRRGRRIAMTPE